MGNLINYSRGGDKESNSINELNMANIPNHLLIDIISSWLSENDVATFRLVCRRWNWLVSVTPNDRLPKLHVARLGVDCRSEGDDVVCVKQRNCSAVGIIRGRTKEGTLQKLKRLTCDELRLCGHHQQPTFANNDPSSSPTLVAAAAAAASRRSSFDGELVNGHVAVNPTLFTTILESSHRTLTRIYVFRCSLFRFTEKDLSALVVLDNLTMLSICRVSDANAVNDNSLLPVVTKGTLEKLVLDRMPITDRLMMALSEKCKKLSLLSVWGCTGVTETGVAAVANGIGTEDGSKIICRQTQFDCMRFLRDSPRFRLSVSGRALELPRKKISIHFV